MSDGSESPKRRRQSSRDASPNDAAAQNVSPLEAWNATTQGIADQAAGTVIVPPPPDAPLEVRQAHADRMADLMASPRQDLRLFDQSYGMPTLADPRFNRDGRGVRPPDPIPTRRAAAVIDRERQPIAAKVADTEADVAQAKINLSQSRAARDRANALGEPVANHDEVIAALERRIAEGESLVRGLQPDLPSEEQRFVFESMTEALEGRMASDAHGNALEADFLEWQARFDAERERKVAEISAARTTSWQLQGRYAQFMGRLVAIQDSNKNLERLV